MTNHRSLTGPSLHIARSNASAGSPIGSLIPTIVGEFYLDTVTNDLYVATGTATTSDWAIISGSGPSRLVSFPTFFHPEFTPVLFTRSSIAHYAGWSLVDNRHDGNDIGSIYPVFVREQDATSLDRTTSLTYRTDSGGVAQWDINLHTQIPQGFTQFGALGITLRHRFNNWDITTGAETADLTLEAYDPDNAAEVVGATITRSRDGTQTDAGYVDLTLTQASLNAMGFTGGDMLRLRIVGDKTAGASFVDQRIGRLLADFQ